MVRLDERWARWSRRRKNRQDFEAAGAYHVRRQVEASIYESEKHRNAQDWLYELDTKYPRRSSYFAFLAVIMSLGALITAWLSYESVRQSNRAWLGPASLRLNHAIEPGTSADAFVDYQNSGHQPALDAFYDLDSYTFSKQMEVDMAERTNRHIDRCKKLEPTDGTITIFPGSGALPRSYHVGESLTNALKAPATLILFDGCFVYQTVGKRHITAFCYQYDPDQIRLDGDGKPLLDLCKYGNYAD
jgi:hypothetical protein